MISKTYLGDGVYLALDERGIILTTENGIETTNTIVLEPEVWAELLGWWQRRQAAMVEQSGAPRLFLAVDELDD